MGQERRFLFGVCDGLLLEILLSVLLKIITMKC